MNWLNLRLIVSREVRDQLRDRRTLFVIFVLPILLYPMLGMSILQVSQFMQQTNSVLVLGPGKVDNLPELIHDGRFDERLLGESGRARALELHFVSEELRHAWGANCDLRAEARRAVQSGQYDAVLYVPADFARQLEAFRRTTQPPTAAGQAAGRRGTDPIAAPAAAPSLEIIWTKNREKSQIAFERLSAVLRQWTDEVGKSNLAARGVPAAAARPFDLASQDVADSAAAQGSNLWSRVLPVLLLIWAVTGAFYPAVDLCAGEKERGTLETLLSSPAERSEIVLGKLLTIMLFSMVTALLNLASVGLTAWLITRQFPNLFSPPSALSVLWLVLALGPISALFSGVCLALAAFARSTKEGQYYLMPVLLVTMPLAMLPSAPGVELGLGNSLIPVTGVVLLLRTLLEGNYWLALQFLPVVLAVTLSACWLAVRWAVEQFNSEAVLFRGGEQFSVRLWLRHLLRDRQPTPTLAAAVACGMLVLLGRFFLTFTGSAPTPGDFGSFVRSILLVQLLVIAAPGVLMALVLTRSVRQTLLLRMPSRRAALGAVALAVVFHPLTHALQVAVQRLYPIGRDLSESLAKMQETLAAPPLWQLLLVLGLLPAVCEELTFRGFILSGLGRLGHKGRAIVYSAVLFGLAHAILQQSLIACLVGVVIGVVAVQSGSILPGMLFHFCHNALAVANARITPEAFAQWPALDFIASPAGKQGCDFSWPIMVYCMAAGATILLWFARNGAVGVHALACGDTLKRELQPTR